MTAVASPRTIAAAAIAVGAFGVSYGVLATTAGMTPLEVVVASATIFAGSAQFAALATITSGGSAAAAVVAALALNLRYLPFGVAVASVLPRRRLLRLVGAHVVIDEGVVLASRPDGTFDGPTLVRVGAWLLLAWVGGSAVGAVAGDLVGDPLRLGLDAAFPALFLALLAPRLKADARSRWVAAAGAAVALATIPVLPPGVPVALGVLGVVAAGRATPATGDQPDLAITFDRATEDEAT